MLTSIQAAPAARAVAPIDFGSFQTDVRSSVPVEIAEKIIAFVMGSFPSFSMSVQEGNPVKGSWEETGEERRSYFVSKIREGQRESYVKIFRGETSFKRCYQYIFLEPRNRGVVCFRKPATLLPPERWRVEVEREVSVSSRFSSSKYFFSPVLEYHQKRPAVPKAIVTPWCEWGNLFSASANPAFRGLSVQVYINLAVQICSAIDLMHKNRLIHGDIKSANFLLQKAPGGYSVKICDFGNTCPVNDIIPFPRATREYMSPESWKKNIRASTSLDLWSLGIVFVELFCGVQNNPYANIHRKYSEEQMENPVLFEDIKAEYIRLQKGMIERIRGSGHTFSRLFMGLLHENPKNRVDTETAIAYLCGRIF